jgi:hypothetical protein
VARIKVAAAAGSKATETSTTIAQFVKSLEHATDVERMAKVKKMLRADSFQLFSEVNDDHVTGVVKSQTDASLFYACKITSQGDFMCCTQNLNVCGGLRGAPCKHLLLLMIGLAQGGAVDIAALSKWAAATKKKSAALDKNAMSATFIKYKGAQAGEIDWRPTETIPEDYYAM